MFNEVLVAVEGTESDLLQVSFGNGLAAQMQVPVSVLSVVADDGVIERHRKSLAFRIAELDLKNVEITVRSGKNVEEILAGEMERRSGALLCMRTLARRPAAEAVLGSVAQGVVRSHPRPVLLLGPHFSSRWGHRINVLLVCVDGSGLSEAMLDHAVNLAKDSGSELRLVEVLSPDRGGLNTASDVAGESSYLHQIAARMRSEHDLRPSWDVLHGNDAGEAIVNYANATPGAVVALTTHGRSGLSQVILGSVAHRTVRDAACPVFVMRP